MRVGMILSSASLGAAMLFPAVVQAAPKVGERIVMTACPYAGVTGNCLMIKGADGTVYNITGATPRPQLNGLMIRLRGTVSDKMSICGQGAVLDRIRWTHTRQRCAN